MKLLHPSILTQRNLFDYSHVVYPKNFVHNCLHHAILFNILLLFCKCRLYFTGILHLFLLFFYIVNIICIFTSVGISKLITVVKPHSLSLSCSSSLMMTDKLSCIIQGGSNMTGTNCDLFTHK